MCYVPRKIINISIAYLILAGNSGLASAQRSAEMHSPITNQSSEVSADSIIADNELSLDEIGLSVKLIEKGELRPGQVAALAIMAARQHGCNTAAEFLRASSASGNLYLVTAAANTLGEWIIQDEGVSCTQEELLLILDQDAFLTDGTAIDAVSKITESSTRNVLWARSLVRSSQNGAAWVDYDIARQVCNDSVAKEILVNELSRWSNAPNESPVPHNVIRALLSAENIDVVSSVQSMLSTAQANLQNISSISEGDVSRTPEQATSLQHAHKVANAWCMQYTHYSLSRGDAAGLLTQLSADKTAQGGSIRPEFRGWIARMSLIDGATPDELRVALERLIDQLPATAKTQTQTQAHAQHWHSVYRSKIQPVQEALSSTDASDLVQWPIDTDALNTPEFGCGHVHRH